ncbi:hypothetical protein PIB30_009284 [Stylosanthes scabra]|uniref:Uncharacterized protein n=1 Tax=Stylosanthes scabra TaxID=79078 RepID=A0ABU6T503_9FABA|nr:hypothetical protein [Stylosanthes scabra]
MAKAEAEQQEWRTEGLRWWRIWAEGSGAAMELSEPSSFSDSKKSWGFWSCKGFLAAVFSFSRLLSRGGDHLNLSTAISDEHDHEKDNSGYQNSLRCGKDWYFFVNSSEDKSSLGGAQRCRGLPRRRPSPPPQCKLKQSSKWQLGEWRQGGSNSKDPFE